MTKSAALWGIYAVRGYLIYSGSVLYDQTECVATFDTKEAAEEYIKKSRLARRDGFREFKYSSILGGWSDPNVKEFEITFPPHNPKIDWE